MDDDFDDDPPPRDIPPPRSLKGRRARRIWRETSQLLDARGQYNAATGALLASFCTFCAEIEAAPDSATQAEISRIRALGRALDLLK